MTNVSEQHQYVNARSLPELASVLSGDVGTAGMSAADVELILAYLIQLPQLLDRLTGGLCEEHFQPGERQYWLLCRQMVDCANGNGSAIPLEAIRAAIRRRIADDARAEFERFLSEHEPRLAACGGELAGIQDWGSKLPGAVARIAGILHLVTEAEDFRHPVEA